MRAELLELIFGFPVHGRVLTYVWGGLGARGEALRNPHIGEESWMIVLRPGHAPTGRWLAERRDLVADYQAAFGEAPPARGIIAIAADSEAALAMAALGLGAQFGVLLPFSRTHESEADELGIYFSASAGYDPEAAIRLWQRMGELSAGAPPEFMSTHPAHDTRIERLREAMPKAKEWGRKAGHSSP